MYTEKPDDFILFVQVPVMFIFLRHKQKNETTGAYCRLSTIKCQHRIAHTAHPPHFEQREKRVTLLPHKAISEDMQKGHRPITEIVI